MRILHIGKYFSPFRGGIENFMHDLMCSQEESGHDCSALVHAHSTKQRFQVIQGVAGKVFTVPIIGQAIFIPLAPAFYRYLRLAIKEVQPDILHLHMPNVSCFWALFSMRARSIPWIIHWHSDVLGANPDWRVKLLYPFYRVFEKALLNKADIVVVTSPAYLQSSEALEGAKHKCVVVPLGLNDLDIESNSCSEQQGINVLCIGRLTYYKGHKYLIEAMASLKTFPIKLRVVGEGELGDELKELAKQYSLDSTVTFLGRLDDQQLHDEIALCDVLALPSIERTEAFGLVLLEAMRAGKPCVVTNVPGSGMGWVVKHNETGVIVPVADSDALAKSFIELLHSPEKRRRFGENGRRRFEQNFQMAKVGLQVDEVYIKLSAPDR